MSERLVIVVEYDMVTNSQQALNGAMGQIREGANRLNPEHIKVVSVHIAIKESAEQVLAVFDKDAA